jgi:hypothetical protein
MLLAEQKHIPRGWLPIWQGQSSLARRQGVKQWSSCLCQSGTSEEIRVSEPKLPISHNLASLPSQLDPCPVLFQVD